MREAIQAGFAQIHLSVTDAQLDKFITFTQRLLEWNTRMNLTRITLPEEIAQKHFADSLLPLAFDLLKQGAHCIDVGTGAGFPGIPLMILRPDLRMTLLDSLAKRLRFLEAVCEELQLKPAFVHARAEDAAQMPAHRHCYDVALSRALAPAPVLMELTLPFVKQGGVCICYKSNNVQEEFAQADRALQLLGGGKPKVYEKTSDWGNRSIVCVPKVCATPKQYPRQAGTAAKNPLHGSSGKH